MLDIKSYIKKIMNYTVKDRSKFPWVEEIISEDLKGDVFFVVPLGFFDGSHKKQRESFLEKYNIKGVFELGDPFVSRAANFFLVFAMTEKVNELYFSLFSGTEIDNYNNTVSTEDTMSGRDILPKDYTEQYEEYLKQIEKWIDGGKQPLDDSNGQYEFNKVSSEKIDYKKLYPRYYSKKAMEIREIAERESFIKLGDVAEVITPFFTGEQDQVPILDTKNLNYPLDINSLNNGAKTTVVLEKGDIIFTKHGKNIVFLYNIESDKPIFASRSTEVIRCKSILPEYLYLYLCSDTAKVLYNMVSKGKAVSHISFVDLVELPVAQQKQSDKKYIDEFNLLSRTTRDDSYYSAYRDVDDQFTSRMKAYDKRIKALNKSIEDIIDEESVARIRIYCKKNLQGLLGDDIKELNICFKHGAYKATLILAGSILEAVLIDWLSEMKGDNFFKKDYIVYDKESDNKENDDVIDGNTGEKKKKKKPRKAVLKDYIEEIKDIKKPHWMKEAQEADEIRDKRNLVHAKLCLKSDVDINEETCRQVIGYLDDVLKTRGVSQSKNKREKA